MLTVCHHHVGVPSGVEPSESLYVHAGFHLMKSTKEGALSPLDLEYTHNLYLLKLDFIEE